MAHEIYRQQNGADSFAYAGAGAWHGLGQPITPGMTREQIAEAAGMAFRIQRSKVRYYLDKNGASQREWPEQHVLFRSDDGKPIATCSDKYHVHQPQHILDSMLDLCERNRLTLETAGVIKGGAVYWALAKIDREESVVPGDFVKAYVMMLTSADLSMRTRLEHCAERVVCANTMNAALSERGTKASQSHRSKLDSNTLFADAGFDSQVAQSVGAFESFMVQARELAARPMGKRDALAFTLAMLGGFDSAASYAAADLVNKTPDTADLPAPIRDVLETKHAQGIATLYAGAAKGSDLAPGTRWQMLNAVTEYVDHAYPARSEENRFASSMFGLGARMKRDALALLAA